MPAGSGRGGSEGQWPPRSWPLVERPSAGPPPAGGARRPPSLFDDVTPGRTPRSAVPVSTLAQLTKQTLEGAIRPLWVRGEVTGFKGHRSGHWYFALRDAAALLRCVVWSSDQRGIATPPEDGREVVVLGQITAYPPRGEMQLRVTSLQVCGDGTTRMVVERTLERLKRDGLLAAERKRGLPRFPRCLAVVTSPDGAALHDIIVVAQQRLPSLRIVVVPTKVQGDGAPQALCAALDRLHRWGGADVVIVGRGGGAKEDLGAFNDERVARAVARCRWPTISAVGHEIDTTLCDLVADHRAPTPSAAAEAAVPLRASQETRVRTVAARIVALSRRRLDQSEQRLTHAASAARRGATRLQERRQARLAHIATRIEALSPLAVLARGYAMAIGVDGRPLAAATDFTPGGGFELIVRDGVIRAVTSEVLPPRWHGAEGLVAATPASPRAEAQKGKRRRDS
jgi:exodeoxyribonuclease VII large subunit